MARQRREILLSFEHVLWNFSKVSNLNIAEEYFGAFSLEFDPASGKGNLLTTHSLCSFQHLQVAKQITYFIAAQGVQQPFGHERNF